MVSCSKSDNSEGSGKSLPFFETYSEYFHEVFPYHLLCGMTYEQYWNGDPAIAIDYRKADKLRQKRQNETLWLQGMYIYEAICDAAPILRSFSKRGTRPKPYASEPYSLDAKEKEIKEEKHDRDVYTKGMTRMEAWVAHTNSKFKKQGGGDNADNH